MITDAQIAATLARVDATLDHYEYHRDQLWFAARKRSPRAATAGLTAVAAAMAPAGPAPPRVPAPVPAPDTPRPGGAAVRIRETCEISF